MLDIIVLILLAKSIDLYTGRWDFVLISIVFYAIFLLFIPFKKKVDWRAHGTYTAFLVALFAEMFGFPLTIYLISSTYFENTISFQSEFLNYMNWIGMPVGYVITGLGLLFVIFGWKPIYKSNKKHALTGKGDEDGKEEGRIGFVTTGIYRYIRHPQYLGFILITLGWLVHWPTIPTAIMWPILVIMYYKLAKKEEKDMQNKYGYLYLAYTDRVPMFIPRTIHSIKQ